MPQPKFNFVPERQATKSSGSEYTVSIQRTENSKGQTFFRLVFPAFTVELYELEGKYIRLYADVEKKAIGWSVFEKADGLNALEDLTKLEKVGSNNRITVGLTKLMKAVGVEPKESLFDIPVSTYKSMLSENPIYYIEVKNPVV